MGKVFITLLASVLLSGCAGLYRLNNAVSTYSQWPAESKPASYAFERLPSQQTRPEQQQRLEDAARHAIEGAGFTPATDPSRAEFTIQLGARVNANDTSLYDDPFWWHGGLHSHRAGASFGLMGFGWIPSSPTYERQIALLIRNRQTGQSLFEAHATNDGNSPSLGPLLQAMFDAAMTDFPHGGVNPRQIVTYIDR